MQLVRQNARLAARLTGFKIDIKSETQARESGDFLDYENDYEDEEYDDEYDENMDDVAYEDEQMDDSQNISVETADFEEE